MVAGRGVLGGGHADRHRIGNAAIYRHCAAHFDADCHADIDWQRAGRPDIDWRASRAIVYCHRARRPDAYRHRFIYHPADNRPDRHRTDYHPAHDRRGQPG